MATEDSRSASAWMDPPAQAEALYYIQHKGYQGNCLVWWADGGHGYTCDLDKAWKVQGSRARDICKDRPMEDFPRSAKDVDRFAVRHVTQEFERAHPTIAERRFRPPLHGQVVTGNK